MARKARRKDDASRSIKSLAELLGLPPSPLRGAAAVQLAFEHSPAMRELHLTAKQAGDSVAIAGVVPGVGLRELAESLARNALRGRRLDASGLLVSDARIAEELNQVLATLPGVLGPRASSASQDLLDGIAASRIEVVQGSGNQVHLAGTAPDLAAKNLITVLAAGIAGARPVDDKGIRIDDSYIAYVVRSGDAPESIARRLCGSARRLDSIRTFSRENTETLALMKVGSVLRIPKRLLKTHLRAAEERKGCDSGCWSRQVARRGCPANGLRYRCNGEASFRSKPPLL
jgi:hypothetical protein